MFWLRLNTAKIFIGDGGVLNEGDDSGAANLTAKFNNDTVDAAAGKGFYGDRLSPSSRRTTATMSC